MSNWKPMADHGGYDVSDAGEIRSSLKGAIVSQRYDKDGYAFVRLYRDGKRVEKRVHRAVLEAWVGPCPPRCQGNHKNFDKSDNRLENLEWTTPSENTRHAGQGQRYHVPARFIQSLPLPQLNAVRRLADERFDGDWNASIREVVRLGVESLPGTSAKSETAPARKSGEPASGRVTVGIAPQEYAPAPCCGSETKFHWASCHKKGQISGRD